METGAAGARLGRVKSPQNLIGGLLMIGLAALVFWLIEDLPVGRALRMGPAYFPRLLAYLVLATGFVLVAVSFFVRGPELGHWAFGRLSVVLLAIVVFAFSVRPLGLLVTGVLVLGVASAAAPDFRWRQTLLFGAGLLAFVILLFPVALGLPLPIWPSILP
ncbi:MAG TPA: tripartite tricarboxylate transporter TctB family protein [Azospirillaceae bacterium]|nr:tripartite tricarboxylate transporter TctB family protein [Azospirillaceae bacterium]